MSNQTGKVRHARLFEMLRQQNQAANATARLKSYGIRKVSSEEANQIKTNARRSLQMQA